jgi:hypothetical protein
LACVRHKRGGGTQCGGVQHFGRGQQLAQGFNFSFTDDGHLDRNGLGVNLDHLGLEPGAGVDQSASGIEDEFFLRRFDGLGLGGGVRFGGWFCFDSGGFWFSGRNGSLCLGGGSSFCLCLNGGGGGGLCGGSCIGFSGSGCFSSSFGRSGSSSGFGRSGSFCFSGFRSGGSL